MERKKLIKFGIDWAAILALALCFIAFTAIKGTAFMSQSNMVNILRAMAITTVFGIAATITMPPEDLICQPVLWEAVQLTHLYHHTFGLDSHCLCR